MVPSIIPVMRYDDAPTAIEWLERAFGFERHFVVPGADGKIDHAELRLGSGMIMLGSTRDDELSLRDPHTLGGLSQGVYIWLDDVETPFIRAKEAGAEIVRELADTDYGSRDFIVRDPEGYLWSFGTYRPEIEAAVA